LNLSKIQIFLLLFIFAISFLFSCKKEIVVDILIQNGIVYDGVTDTPLNVSIGIKEDKIIYVGDGDSIGITASKIIDAKELIVAPGFIDPHTHADRDLVIPEKSQNEPFLFQGITTVVVGNDGDSFYPLSKYKTLYQTQGIGTNVIFLVGQGTIRQEVVGMTDREATEKEIAKMQKLVQQEMDAGAFGMSTGLFYAPGSYASTEEVIALAKTVALNHGIYDTHLRDESSYTVGLIPAIEEAIEIGRQAKLPIHISHIKCLGVDVWYQSDSIIKLIEKAQKEGVNITASQYPYDASATSLQAATIPRWAESGGKDSLFIRYNNPAFRHRLLNETRANIDRRGGPEKLLIVRINDTSLMGKNLKEVSEMMKTSPEETVFKLLKNNNIGVASFNMNQGDIENFMKQEWVVTGSDGNTGHPRKYGSFPRKYHKYVKTDSILDLATFVNGSTSKTAEIFKIPERGKLKEGYYADIIIFNPETFTDKADYNNAFQLSDGLEYSIINGKLAIEKGKSTNQLNGRVLTK